MEGKGYSTKDIGRLSYVLSNISHILHLSVHVMIHGKWLGLFQVVQGPSISGLSDIYLVRYLKQKKRQKKKEKHKTTGIFYSLLIDVVIGSILLLLFLQTVSICS